MWNLLPLPRPSKLHEVLFPSKVVRQRGQAEGNDDRLKTLLIICGALVLNLLLYAVPPTVPIAARLYNVRTSLPSLFTTPSTVDLIVELAGQLAFVTVTMFAGFYVALCAMRISQSSLKTLQAIINSTGIYLATSFTLLQYFLSLPHGRDFLAAVSAWAVHVPLRFMARAVAVPADRITIPREIPFRIVPDGILLYGPQRVGAYRLPALTAYEQTVLCLLVLSVCFYVYAFYCTARINNGATRTGGVIATGMAILGPYLVLSLYLLPPSNLLPAVFGAGITGLLGFLYVALT